jgi:hypothetical protein
MGNSVYPIVHFNLNSYHKRRTKLSHAVENHTDCGRLSGSWKAPTNKESPSPTQRAAAGKTDATS